MDFLALLFGWTTGIFGVNFLASSTSSPSQNWVLNVSDWVIKFIFRTESFKRFSYYATPEEKSKGIVTIGYGTTSYFSLGGRPFLYKGSSRVKIGQDLEDVKKTFGFNGTTEQFAKQLVLNFYKNPSNRINRFISDMNKMNIPFNQRLLDVCVDFSYNSGSHFGSFASDSFYTFFLNEIKNAKTQRDLALAFFRYRFLYVRNFAKGNFENSKHGWLIRFYAAAKYLETGQEIWLNSSDGFVKNQQKVSNDFGIRFTLY